MSPAEPPLTGEHACTRCGYALLGLKPDGRCPECGQSIADSLAVHAPLPRRDALHAANSLAVSISGGLLHLLAIVGGIFAGELAFALIGIAVTAMLARVVGLWQLTSPRRVRTPPGASRALPLVLRAVSVLQLVSMLGLAAFLLRTSVPLLASSPSVGSGWVASLFICWVASSVLSGLLLVGLGDRLARSCRLGDLKSGTGLTGTRLGIVSLLGLVLYGLGPVLGYIWYQVGMWSLVGALRDYGDGDGDTGR